MERIADTQSWKIVLFNAKRLSVKGSDEEGAKTLLPYIKELQNVPPTGQMISDLHRLSARELGCALWEQAKGLEKAEFALMYAQTLLTQGKTLIQKVVALKQYFISNCDINYNWLLYIRLPKQRIKPRSTWLRLVAIPSFRRR